MYKSNSFVTTIKKPFSPLSTMFKLENYIKQKILNMSMKLEKEYDLYEIKNSNNLNSIPSVSINKVTKKLSVKVEMKVHHSNLLKKSTKIKKATSFYLKVNE